VSTSEVDTWRSVSFWTEKLTEVLIRSFPITEVSSVMQIETQGLKNKVSKTQGLKRCLTLLLNIRTKVCTRNVHKKKKKKNVSILFIVKCLNGLFFFKKKKKKKANKKFIHVCCGHGAW